MATKLPAHGTRARYRIEIKPKADGSKGQPCDRCKAANTQASREQRSNARATVARSKFTVVGDVADAPDVDASVDASTEPTVGHRGRRSIGAMERAVDSDIKDIDTDLRVPFHRSLSVLARQLAREIDEPSTPANARSQSSRQLFEVLKSLRTQKEGDDNSAVAVALQATGFGSGPPRLP